MVVVVGIDPGATGGVFRLETDKSGDIVKYSMQKCSQDDKDTVATLIDQITKPKMADLVVVEQVSSFPGQGVTSTFTFGKRFGVLLGTVHALGATLAMVTPKRWQKDLGLTLPKGTGDLEPTPAKKRALRKKLQKAAAYDTALAKFPNTEKGSKKVAKETADAALIALWGLNHSDA